MCGIAGYTKPLDVAPEVLAEMVDCQRRRGPDARGEWRDDLLALGHRRLSVLDLSPRAGQPMISETGRTVIVYNGECYNHLELRNGLPDRPWRTHSDTETILRLYEERGEGFVRELNGMFAIAIYDLPARQLLLYRDRVGIKPLYVYHHGGLLLFASQLKALLNHPGFSRQIDPGSVRDYLLFNYVPGDRCIFRHTRQVPPGCFLRVDLTTMRHTLTRYWAVEDILAEPAAQRDPRDRKLWESRTDELEALIFDSVRMRTLSDVPLGCFLSGGVDSSVVAMGLGRQSTAQPRTFTIGFREKKYDESDHARAVSDHLGTRHTCRIVTPRDCLDLVEELPEICDEPFADASIIPTALLSRLTRENVTVSLSGDGGDELFLGYDRYLWAEKVGTRLGAVPGMVRRAGAAVARRVPHYRTRMIAGGLGFGRPEELYPSVFIGWNSQFVDALMGERSDFSRHRIHRTTREAGHRSLLEQAGYTDLRRYLVDDILTKVDRASMHYSLESRVPLLDHRIVEFALRLPVWMRCHGREQKILLRRVLYRHVPRRLFERPKSGFAVPLRSWFRGPLKPLLRDSLSPEALAGHGLFDQRAVERMLRRHFSGRWNFERQLWGLLSFQLWHGRYMA